MLSFLVYQGNALIITTYTHIQTLFFMSDTGVMAEPICVWVSCLCHTDLLRYQTALPHPTSGCVNLELWIIQGNWPRFTHTPSGHTHSTVLSAGLRDMGTTFKTMCLNNTSHLSMLAARWRVLLSLCYVRNPPNSPF